MLYPSQLLVSSADSEIRTLGSGISGLRSRRGRNHQEPQTVGSASVGVILDSSAIIAAERRGRTVRQILEQMTAPGTTESR